MRVCECHSAVCTISMFVRRFVKAIIIFIMIDCDCVHMHVYHAEPIASVHVCVSVCECHVTVYTIHIIIANVHDM